MLKIIISHFYNEEYLLPWWLEHHKKIFDHGVLIDYNSTDRSVEIIKNICPTWTIVNSRFEFFDAQKIEEEVIEIEKQFEGWKFCLNTTEFFIGDLSYLDDSPDNEYIIPCHIMVDVEPDTLPDYSKPLIEQKYHGVHSRYEIRRPRKIHNKPVEDYPLGRHYPYHHISNEDMAVLWYGFSPYNEHQIKRKLQIQNKIPESDKRRGFGIEHVTTKEKLSDLYTNCYLPRTEDLRKYFKRYRGI